MILIRPGQWQLTLAPKSSVSAVLSLVGKLADSKPAIHVLDGGNRFNAFEVAEAVGGSEAVLDKIQVSRSFTCYELENLLETTHTTNTTFVCLDFLGTFFDESIQFHERHQLLRKSLNHIRRLNGTSGVWVIAHPPAVPSPSATNLIKTTVNASSELWLPEVVSFEPEGIDPDMGKTVPSFTQVFDKIQGSLSKFRSALLLRSARDAFDVLFAKARNYAGIGGQAARPLPFETILLCMLIEQQQELTRLKGLIDNRK